METEEREYQGCDPDLYRIEVEPNQANERLDVLVAGLGVISRTRGAGLIRDGWARVNGEVVEKAGMKVSAGDLIEILVPPPPPEIAEPEPVPLDVIYEDECMAVLNKAPGMVVHPSETLYSGTMVNGMLYRFGSLSTLGGPLRPGIVHRLDKGTSGVMIAAKTDEAHEKLTLQFKSQTVRKQYLALVHGEPFTREFTVDHRIRRHPKDRQRMAVTEEPSLGREAHTRFVVEILWNSYALVRAFPSTGRTHQIRVHLQYSHLPIVGDTKYGYQNRGILRTGLALLCADRKGFMLHAHKISFEHPGTGERVEFEAPLEPVFQDTIEALDDALGREE